MQKSVQEAVDSLHAAEALLAASFVRDLFAALRYEKLQNKKSSNLYKLAWFLPADLWVIRILLLAVATSSAAEKPVASCLKAVQAGLPMLATGHVQPDSWSTVCIWWCGPDGCQATGCSASGIIEIALFCCNNSTQTQQLIRLAKGLAAAAFLRWVTQIGLLKFRRAEAAREQETAAAVCIQAHARGFLQRVYLGYLRHVLELVMLMVHGVQPSYWNWAAEQVHCR